MWRLASNHWIGVLAISAGLLSIPIAAAADCPTSPGHVIFSDAFNDGNGGWETDSSAVFKDNTLTMMLGAQESDWVYVNNGFDARDADYCVEAVMPKAPPGKNSAAVGMALLYTDENNYTRLEIFDDSTVQLARRSGGEWTDLLNEEVEAVKPSPGSVVTLRVTIKDGLLTAYVNGTEVKKTRLKIPDGALKFGLVADADKAPGTPFPFVFKAVQINAAP